MKRSARSPGYQLQNANTPSPRDEDWLPFHVELELDAGQALDLCRTLAAARGGQESWRVVDGATGTQIVRISGYRRDSAT